MMKKHLTVSLDRETLSLLKAEAGFQKMSAEELAEKILREYIERLEGGPEERR
jgi:hypothetical protein